MSATEDQDKHLDATEEELLNEASSEVSDSSSEATSEDSVLEESVPGESISEENSHSEEASVEDSEPTIAEPVSVAPVAPVSFLSRAQWLQVYLIIAIFSSTYWLFLDGHFDIGFWKEWVTQLANNGFKDYKGDYPPLWSNWLYVVSRFYIYTQLPIENTILFKYLTQMPVTVYQVVLTYLIYKIADKYATSDAHFHTALVLTVFNPAILFNGPIWGQIDIAPIVPVIAALMAGMSQRFQIFAVPLFALGLLTKFQMIAFAPVMGILFFRNYKKHLLGALLSVPVFLIAFLPNILAGNFQQAFTLPYISSMHMFNSATMSASNIWVLAIGNLTPDTIILFGIDPASPKADLFSVRHVGMISFSLVCLFVFLAGLRKLIIRKRAQDDAGFFQDLLFFATVCAITFFTILPGMHERYLLPAVVISLAYYATSSSRLIYPLVLTFISFFNLVMVHGIKTPSLWPSLSWMMVIFFGYTLLQLVLGERWVNLCKYLVQKITSFKALGVVVLLGTFWYMTHDLYEKTRIHKAVLADNQILLTQLQPTYAAQDYGTLQVNQNISGAPLSVAGRRYADGFGVHASSTVNFVLPPNAKSFSFIAALDDEVGGADVRFSVWGNGKMLWQSGIEYTPVSQPTTVTLALDGITELSLQVSSLGNISSDHADWIEPIITLEKSTPAQ